MQYSYVQRSCLLSFILLTVTVSNLYGTFEIGEGMKKRMQRVMPLGCNRVPKKEPPIINPLTMRERLKKVTPKTSTVPKPSLRAKRFDGTWGSIHSIPTKKKSHKRAPRRSHTKPWKKHYSATEFNPLDPGSINNMRENLMKMLPHCRSLEKDTEAWDQFQKNAAKWRAALDPGVTYDGTYKGLFLRCLPLNDIPDQKFVLKMLFGHDS